MSLDRSAGHANGMMRGRKMLTGRASDAAFDCQSRSHSADNGELSYSFGRSHARLRRPYAFRGIKTLGKAEGGDAKHGHLPLESRRAFRRLREPDFSPARGNLPTPEYLTTPFCSSQSTALEAVKLPR